jgi:hypothetical protein
VTESDWNRCTDPHAMLVFLHATGRLPGRKGRLFSVACCDRVWHDGAAMRLNWDVCLNLQILDPEFAGFPTA